MNLSQQRAEDIYLHHCYRYYILNSPEIYDFEFDKLHKNLIKQFPNSKIINSVGSSNLETYPLYIREMRRPLLDELRK